MQILAQRITIMQCLGNSIDNSDCSSSHVQLTNGPGYPFTRIAHSRHEAEKSPGKNSLSNSIISLCREQLFLGSDKIYATFETENESTSACNFGPEKMHQQHSYKASNSAHLSPPCSCSVTLQNLCPVSPHLRAASTASANMAPTIMTSARPCPMCVRPATSPAFGADSIRPLETHSIRKASDTLVSTISNGEAGLNGRSSCQANSESSSDCHQVAGNLYSYLPFLIVSSISILAMILLLSVIVIYFQCEYYGQDFFICPLLLLPLPGAASASSPVIAPARSETTTRDTAMQIMIVKNASNALGKEERNNL